VATVPFQHAVALAGVLFAMGTAGLLVRRNLVVVLMSIEVMLNAAGLAFVAAGARWAQPDGQVFFVLVLATAAAEVAVGLALLLALHRHVPTLDADAASEMKG
jgi:NADH-quinone oxidoreductase subunit K